MIFVVLNKFSRMTFSLLPLSGISTIVTLPVNAGHNHHWVMMSGHRTRHKHCRIVPFQTFQRGLTASYPYFWTYTSMAFGDWVTSKRDNFPACIRPRSDTVSCDRRRLNFPRTQTHATALHDTDRCNNCRFIFSHVESLSKRVKPLLHGEQVRAMKQDKTTSIKRKKNTPYNARKCNWK